MKIALRSENLKQVDIVNIAQLRDWSLITGRGGGLQNGRGGVVCEVLPLRKGGGGAEKVLAIEVLAIL